MVLIKSPTQRILLVSMTKYMRSGRRTLSHWSGAPALPLRLTCPGIGKPQLSASKDWPALHNTASTHLFSLPLFFFNPLSSLPIKTSKIQTQASLGTLSPNPGVCITAPQKQNMSCFHEQHAPWLPTINITTSIHIQGKRIKYTWQMLMGSAASCTAEGQVEQLRAH